MVPNQYQKTRPIKGMLLFFISQERYLNAAVGHTAYLEDQELDGADSPDLEEIRDQESQNFKIIRSQLIRSFIWIICLVLGLIVGWMIFNVIWISELLDWTRGLSFIGTALVGWAALFELGGEGLASWGGETLSELVHPIIFQILFIPGLFCLLCSILL